MEAIRKLLYGGVQQAELNLMLKFPSSPQSLKKALCLQCGQVEK